ncbi:hypothetical protein C4544_05385 [candidate division WS5 bacterium]|uniref:Uncharacterized protein n=1 Tax=candidate division WS5 bacterium TaxID=2093353 RepID=A0A419DB32_9BACT|nr:MAG: hypothetical protein C4544_05385 [candidate division WS5 bacterium]
MDDKDRKARLKKQAEDEAISSTQMSNEDIIKGIHYCSSVPPPYGDSTSLKKSIAYFSSLLFNLSRQAEESTNKTIKLTKQIYYLTWFIAILTAVLLFVGFFEFPKKRMFHDQQANQTTKNNQQDDSSKTQ